MFIVEMENEMKKQEIILKVFDIFEDIIDLEGKKPSIDFQQKDIEEWDSFGQIRFISAIEEEFKIQILFEKKVELVSIRLIVDHLLENLPK